MVQLQGTHSFKAPQEVVWEALLDPQVLSKALPGMERLEQVGENEYEGEINIRVGPVQGKFQGKVTLSEITPPSSYHLTVQGQGAPGYVTGAGDLRLESDGDATTLHYSGEAQLSGRIASVGQRLIDSTARSLTRQGLQSLDAIIAARLAATEAEAPIPEIVPPSTTQVATEVAKDVISDLVPAEQRPMLRRAAIVLGIIIVALILYFLFFR